MTKRRYDILKAGNEYIKSVDHTAKFCYADVNYSMGFFESLQELKDLVDINCLKLDYVNFVVLMIYFYSQQAFSCFGMV